MSLIKTIDLNRKAFKSPYLNKNNKLFTTHTNEIIYICYMI